MKDEALSNDGDKIVSMPIPIVLPADAAAASEAAVRLLDRTASIRAADQTVADWLHHEIGLTKLPAALSEASCLDSDTFVAAVRSALPKRVSLSPAELARVREAFADTAEPARVARLATLADERTLSDIVNRAFGLTPEDVALMWRTAPPRMPLRPPHD